MTSDNYDVTLALKGVSVWLMLILGVLLLLLWRLW
jgi:hypothetical protein